jgi:hypothetical protein
VCNIEIGLFVNHSNFSMLTILASVVEHRFGMAYDHLGIKRIFTLTFCNLYMSTAKLKLVIIIFVVYSCKMNVIQQPGMFVELGRVQNQVGRNFGEFVITYICKVMSHCLLLLNFLSHKMSQFHQIVRLADNDANDLMYIQIVRDTCVHMSSRILMMGVSK